jgi:hypothetical protein
MLSAACLPAPIARITVFDKIFEKNKIMCNFFYNCFVYIYERQIQKVSAFDAIEKEKKIFNNGGVKNEVKKSINRSFMFEFDYCCGCICYKCICSNR